MITNNMQMMVLFGVLSTKAMWFLCLVGGCGLSCVNCETVRVANNTCTYTCVCSFVATQTYVGQNRRWDIGSAYVRSTGRTNATTAACWECVCVYRYVCVSVCSQKTEERERDERTFTVKQNCGCWRQWYLWILCLGVWSSEVFLCVIYPLHTWLFDKKERNNISKTWTSFSFVRRMKEIIL